jgi:hypothetical protein
MRAGSKLAAWLGRVPAPPLALAAAAAALAAFGIALLAGWASAGTHEPLTKARAQQADAAAPHVILLRPAASLPAGPPAPRAKRPARPRPGKKVPNPLVPKLIVGSG